MFGCNQHSLFSSIEAFEAHEPKDLESRNTIPYSKEKDHKSQKARFLSSRFVLSSKATATGKLHVSNFLSIVFVASASGFRSFPSISA